MQKEAGGTPLPGFLLSTFYFGAVTGQSSKLDPDLLHQLLLKNLLGLRFAPPNLRLLLFQRMSF